MKLKYLIFIAALSQMAAYAWFWDKITTKIVNNTDFDIVVDVIYTEDCPAHNDQRIKAKKSKTIETNKCLLKELIIRYNTPGYVWHVTCMAQKDKKTQTFTISQENGELRIAGCKSIEIKKFDTSHVKMLPELKIRK